jgi:hypothetical protein
VPTTLVPAAAAPTHIHSTASDSAPATAGASLREVVCRVGIVARGCPSPRCRCPSARSRLRGGLKNVQAQGAVRRPAAFAAIPNPRAIGMCCSVHVCMCAWQVAHTTCT